MTEELVSFRENEYKELLLQTVAVIERARINVARHIANEVFHSTYNLGFLGVTKPILELELENRLVEKIKMFLLELGKGFTFIGNQGTYCRHSHLTVC